MSAESANNDEIPYEVSQIGSPKVNWDWSIPYGLSFESLTPASPIPDSQAEIEVHSGEGQRILEDGKTRKGEGSPHGKGRLKTHLRVRNQQKFDALRKQLRQEEVDAPLTMVRRQSSPPTTLGPSLGLISMMLPCDIPDDSLKLYLHKLHHTFIDLVSSGSPSAKHARYFATNIMSMYTVSRALLHSSLYAQILYDRVQREIPQATPMEIEVGAEAIRQLNREISDPKRAVSDISIWCVICLAYSGREASLQPRLQHPHQTFLKELQSIHMYCRMEFVAEHVSGLIKMIELIGGLHNIRTPGIAQVISYAGLLSASRDVQKPIFPFIPHTTTFIHDGHLIVTAAEFDAVASELGTLGAGFLNLWKSSSSPEIQTLSDVIRDTCDFTVVVENYIRGRWMQRNVTDIMDQRNYIQHSLMSLKTSKELRSQEPPVYDLYYESCRLATIIYSFLVVFPVPPVPGPFETVTHLLRQELEIICPDGHTMPTLRLYLWILVMGAIACIGLPDRSWFVSRITLLSQEIEIREWKDLQAILQAFLWHPSTSNVDGIDIWDEIQENHTQRQMK